MDAIRITIPGVPRSKGSLKNFVPTRKDGSIVRDKRGKPMVVSRNQSDHTAPWMADVAHRAALALAARGGGMFTGPVAVRAVFRFTRPRTHYRSGRNAHLLAASAPEHHGQLPDVDKLLRAILDALTSVVWLDDRQVSFISGAKVWIPQGEQPGADLIIADVADSPAVVGRIGRAEIDEGLNTLFTMEGRTYDRRN